ncbi:MAG: hypothetical protein OHK0029_37350 [Armatimonadaceae bacterium]
MQGKGRTEAEPIFTMSLLLPTAALRVYDALKLRPGANPRQSDARDAALLDTIATRLNELIDTYRVTANEEFGNTYVFWAEIAGLVNEGVFDDLLDRL